MSSTNITQGDTKAVGTEEQHDIAFNVEVIAVPKNTDNSLISQNKFDTTVDDESAQGPSTAVGTDSKEKQTDNVKEHQSYSESNEYPVNVHERLHDLKRNRSLFSVPTCAYVYSPPRISRSENSNSDPKQEIAIKISEQFNKEDQAGASGVSVDILKFVRDPIKASEHLYPNDDSSFSIKAIGSGYAESGIVGLGTDSAISVTQLILTEQDDGSFVTIEACQKEKMTSTDIATTFSLDNRTQNILVASTDYRNQPPPPYYENSHPQQIAYQGRLGQTPVYQQQNVEYVTVPMETSRAPPYRPSQPDPANIFQTKEIRNKFVRRVYMILAMQLLFTFGFISLCIYEKHTRNFVRRYWEISIAAMVGLFITIITLTCYMATRRMYPLNFILLSILTFFMAYVTAFVSCFYETKIVMFTIGLTAGICTLLSILAYQSWFDITGWGMILCIGLVILMIFGFIATLVYIFTRSDILNIIYSCLLTLLMCVYLVYDTQQILGGRRVEMSPEEYILGALTLYVDIIIIFQNILMLAGRFSR